MKYREREIQNERKVSKKGNLWFFIYFFLSSQSVDTTFSTMSLLFHNVSDFIMYQITHVLQKLMVHFSKMSTDSFKQVDYATSVSQNASVS